MIMVSIQSFIIGIFDDIRDTAAQYAAEIVDLHRADALPFFHPINGGAANVVLVDQGVCGDV